MTVLAVDLAAKYSAVCLMDDRHRVLHEFDSWQKTENRFIRDLADFFHPAGLGQPDVMVVEDLPHGLKYSRLVKTVCRLQGRIYSAMLDNQATAKLLFLDPAAWRAHHGGMGRGTGPGIVFPVAERYGYRPPQTLLARAKGDGGKTRADKVASDYCSAYLIARWAIDTRAKHHIVDVPGTSRYNSPVILKKDFDAKNS